MLRSRADPRVFIGEAVYHFPKPGSRDALCLVLGATVQSLSLDDPRHLEFTTSNGCRVRLPMGAEACPVFPSRSAVAGRLKAIAK